MNRIRWAVIASVVIALPAGSVRAVETSLPSPSHDTDKMHYGGDFGFNYFKDKEGSGFVPNKHDPTEHTRDTPAAGYQKRGDVSCWMAVANNMLQYIGLRDHYQGWAFDSGVKVGTEIRTWDETGSVTLALTAEAEKYAVVNIPWGAGEQWWTNPMWNIRTQFRYNTPVGMSTWASDGNEVWEHVMSVYAIDLEARTVTLADSDGDDGGDTKKYEYAYDGAANSLILKNYGANTAYISNIVHFDANRWREKDKRASDDWFANANWQLVKATGVNKAPDATAVVRVYMEDDNTTIEIDGNRTATAATMDVFAIKDGCRIRLGKNDDRVKLSILGNESLGFNGYRLAGFEHCKGEHTVGGSLSMAVLPSTHAAYELKGGKLTVGDSLVIGERGTASFSQTGGQVLSKRTIVGEFKRGTVEQSAGDHEAQSTFIIGFHSGSIGRYTLKGGTVKTDVGNIGGADGQFVQTGGTVTANHWLIGSGLNDRASHMISGGELHVGELRVGSSISDLPAHTLDIGSSAAEIVVTNSLSFYKSAVLKAVTGSKIHVKGKVVCSYNGTAEARLSGLNDLTLVFYESSLNDPGKLEVACKAGVGFAGNFALEGLTVGLGDKTGYATLLDLFDNGNRPAGGSECLFTENLSILDGSKLDIADRILCVNDNREAALDGWIADGRLTDSVNGAIDAVFMEGRNWTIIGPVGIPEPGAGLLLVLAWPIMARRRHRRPRRPGRGTSQACAGSDRSRHSGASFPTCP